MLLIFRNHQCKGFASLLHGISSYTCVPFYSSQQFITKTIANSLLVLEILRPTKNTLCWISASCVGEKPEPTSYCERLLVTGSVYSLSPYQVNVKDYFI